MTKAKNNRTHTLKALNGDTYYFTSADSGTTMTIRRSHGSSRTHHLTTKHIEEARRLYANLRDGVAQPGHRCG